MSEKLWAASPDRILASNIDRFRRSVAAATGLDLADTRGARLLLVKKVTW
jgi:hypothetical protein